MTTGSTFKPEEEDEVFIVEDDDVVEAAKAPVGDTLIIETGDSIKVKQTFDDAITFILPEDGNVTQNVTGENLKMDNEGDCKDEVIIIRSTFAKFQEFYMLTLQPHSTGGKALNINPFVGSESDTSPDRTARQVVGKMYVGNYFTERGEFYEDGFRADVLTLLAEFRKKNYCTVEFNHSKDKKE